MSLPILSRRGAPLQEVCIFCTHGIRSFATTRHSRLEDRGRYQGPQSQSYRRLDLGSRKSSSDPLPHVNLPSSKPTSLPSEGSRPTTKHASAKHASVKHASAPTPPPSPPKMPTFTRHSDPFTAPTATANRIRPLGDGPITSQTQPHHLPDSAEQRVRNALAAKRPAPIPRSIQHTASTSKTPTTEDNRTRLLAAFGGTDQTPSQTRDDGETRSRLPKKPASGTTPTFEVDRTRLLAAFGGADQPQSKTRVDEETQKSRLPKRSASSVIPVPEVDRTKLLTASGGLGPTQSQTRDDEKTRDRSSKRVASNDPTEQGLPSAARARKNVRAPFQKQDSKPVNTKRNRNRPIYEDIDQADDDNIAVKRRSRRRGMSRAQDDDDDDDYHPRERASALDMADDPEYAELLAVREARKEAKLVKKRAEADREARREQARSERMTPIRMPDFLTMTKLAQMLDITYKELEETMQRLGFQPTTPEHILSAENASLAAIEHNFDPYGTEEDVVDRDLHAQPAPVDKSLLPARPPVVAIMGHVDHGKTTLLDYLRKTSVAAGEHGGITQHIGAFSVEMSSGKPITFLDTPGHAAFLAMRQRGAVVTDIIVLVVAADDSVKPQTLEALKHAKEAGVPIIVAINKVDKPEADIQRVKNDLARHSVEIEDFGGDTQVVCVSGKTGEGMAELEEATLTLSEMLDNRADPTGPVEGWVIEASTKLSGRTATVLVRQGTLTAGDIIVAGQTYARVRVLRNQDGQPVEFAGPGTPVEVEGWRDQPVAGDEMLEAPNEQKANSVISYREAEADRLRLNDDIEVVNKTRRIESERHARERVEKHAIREAKKQGDYTYVPQTPELVKEADADVDVDAKVDETIRVPFIIKTDVSGSAEAVNDYLLQLTNKTCTPIVLRTGVGGVSEFDIEHAAVAGGHIIAFNLPRDASATMQAERRGVKVLYQDVIYRIIDDVKDVLESKLAPLIIQRVTGEAEIATSFEISLGGRKRTLVAGCRVRNGVIGRRAKVRVFRGETKVFDGQLSSLKNVKKDVNEMRKGSECGIGFEDWVDFRPGDTIQAYEEKEEKRTLQL